MCLSQCTRCANDAARQTRNAVPAVLDGVPAFPRQPYPYRRRGVVPFGKSGFVGAWSERVDCLGRALNYPLGIDPVELWRDHLGRPRTQAARLLALEAVVLLEPEALRGEIVWPRAEE